MGYVYTLPPAAPECSRCGGNFTNYLGQQGGMNFIGDEVLCDNCAPGAPSQEFKDEVKRRYALYGEPSLSVRDLENPIWTKEELLKQVTDANKWYPQYDGKFEPELWRAGRLRKDYPALFKNWKKGDLILHKRERRLDSDTPDTVISCRSLNHFGACIDDLSIEWLED